MDFSKQGLQHVDHIENKHFEKLYAATYYHEYEKQLIYDFKYNQKPYLAKEIASMIVSKLGDKEYDAIIAVPLSKEKFEKRQYNQAVEIVKYMSYELKIPSLKKTLIREKDTLPQNDLSPLERIMNLNDAFVIRNSESVKDKKILLIDDIYTTGSTVDICAKTLVLGGAKSVDAAVFARAVFDDKND